MYESPLSVKDSDSSKGYFKPRIVKTAPLPLDPKL